MPEASSTNEQLSSRHSFRLPAKAKQLVEIDTIEQLDAIDFSALCFILGEGTNTLFVNDFQGTVLVNKLRGIDIVENHEYWSISAAGGENWHQFVLTLHARGIHGLENLALIPGSIGAAPVQNIGAYGVEVASFIEAVEFYSPLSREVERWSAAECKFAYRSSRFKTEAHVQRFITRVHFRVPKQYQPVLSYGELQQLHKPVDAATVLAKIIEVRTHKLPDPTVLPNAGSFFKNPTVETSIAHTLKAKFPNLPMFPVNEQQVKLAAGWLIDQAGLKALRVGDAAVHQRQALVLVNLGQATGEQVVALARQIQQRVYQHYGVHLVPEARLIGEHGLLESILDE